MKAFISYSHKDSAILERLHIHLSQLKREGKLNSWFDEVITAGTELDKAISQNLENSTLFIALISPDYIASHYCYEKEFERAISLQEEDKLVIVPIIIEPCDWHNTPFGKFKALPKDGKPISEWNNQNNAFLDIIQNLRNLLQGSNDSIERSSQFTNPLIVVPQRNYRVKKDFDSIQKIELIESSFREIKEKLISFIDEIIQVDNNIKRKLVKDEPNLFEAILVNRNNHLLN